MPIVVPTLKTLIETKVDTAFQNVPLDVSYSGPLSQPNPTYFQLMCLAISTGFASQPTIFGITEDIGLGGTPPVPGTGISIGLDIDRAYFESTLYTTIRDFIIADFGTTSHPPYSDFFLLPPLEPAPDNFLRAFCQGLSEAVEEHFEIAWTINTTNPFVYLGDGEIDEGNLSGLVASTIQSTIIATAPIFIGPFWPRIAEAIATVYVDVIHNHTTNLEPIVITGICSPGGGQACGVPAVGVGMATIT